MAASANDAHPYPIYNARYRVLFPILDADGDLVTGAAGLDSEASQDCGTFADCTNEATEIATSSGMYYLDLIATELDTKSTAIIVKTSTSGAKTTPMVLYPKRLPVVRTGTAQAGASSTITLDSGASAVDDFYNGCFVNITNNSPTNALGQARRIVDYVGSTKVATVEGTWGTNPSSASTFEILLTEEASSMVAIAGTAVVDPATAGRLNVNVTHAAGTAWGSGAITAGSIAASALNGKGDWNVGKTGYSLTATTGLGNQTANITGSLSGSVGSVTGAVGSVTGNVGGNVTGSVGSVTGLTNATIADAVWDEDATAHQTQGTFGQAIGDPAADTDSIWALVNTNLDAAVSSRLSTAGYTAPPSAASVADAVWDEARSGHVSAGSFGEGVASVQGNVTGSVGSVSGAVGSVTGAVGSVTGDVGGNVVGSVASVTAGVTVTTNNDKTGYALSAAGVDAVWDEATSGHTTAGTTGKALTDAGSAGDPWSTAVPGAYSAGTAGYILGTNLDATISSRLASAGYTAPLDAAGTRTAVGLSSANLDTQIGTLATAANLATVAGYLDTEVAAILADTNELQTDLANGGRLDLLIDAIKAKTDNLPAAPAATGDIPTAVQNADALLGRNVAGGSSTGRTVKEALYVLRNKTEISGGTLTVYGTDDTTSAFTATVATTAGDPISSIDPA